MELIRQVIRDVSLQSIRFHIKALEGIRHPVAAPEGLEQAFQYIWHNLKVLGYDMSEQRFPDLGVEFCNIIATQQGVLFPEERVLVVAHFDTVAQSPGADDNASGVAVLLELATVLKPYRFRRTVQFVAVNLEENASERCDSGLRGSTALAQHAHDHHWNIAGVVVLESVAYAGKAMHQSAPAGIPIQLPEAGDFLGVVGNDASIDLIQRFARVIEQHRIELPYQSLAVPGNGEMLPDTRRSDHAPFWDRGYRAVMLTDTTNFRNPNYHQPTDTLETLNLGFASDVCRATGALVMDLAQIAR